MPLTPQDVSNKRFTPVRVRREGYDMGEVDAFLDEVEAELTRLTDEITELRKQGDGQAPTASSAVAPPEETGSDTEAVVVDEEPAPQAPARAPLPSETLKVTTIGEASSAAARLLEIATRNADELVNEAQDQADTILGSARTKSERLDTETRDRNDRLEADARTRAQMLDAETQERRAQLFSDLDQERSKLTAEVDGLRSFGREYRGRLKTYFEQQLSNLATGDTAPAADGHHSSALGSLLSEDDARS